jgi:hypothetical protein
VAGLLEPIADDRLTAAQARRILDGQAVPSQAARRQERTGRSPQGVPGAPSTQIRGQVRRGDLRLTSSEESDLMGMQVSTPGEAGILAVDM